MQGATIAAALRNRRERAKKEHDEKIDALINEKSAQVLARIGDFVTHTHVILSPYYANTLYSQHSHPRRVRLLPSCFGMSCCTYVPGSPACWAPC